MNNLRAHALLREFVRAEHAMAGEDPERLVDLLRHALPAHFDAEERPGGAYEALLARGVSPALVARFCADHLRFLGELDRLAAALHRGEDVRGALWALAQPMRVHERREAAAGIQVGVAMAERTLVPTSDAIAAVVQRATALATEVPGRLLVGLDVHVPDTPSWAVEDALAAAGLEFVEVRVAAEGPTGVQGATFESADTLPDAAAADPAR